MFYSDRRRKKTLLRRLKNIGMTSGKLYRNALKQKSLLKIQSHYSQFSSEGATPSRRKTLLTLQVTPPVVYANHDIFFLNHLFCYRYLFGRGPRPLSREWFPLVDSVVSCGQKASKCKKMWLFKRYLDPRGRGLS